MNITQGAIASDFPGVSNLDRGELKVVKALVKSIRGFVPMSKDFN